MLVFAKKCFSDMTQACQKVMPRYEETLFLPDPLKAGLEIKPKKLITVALEQI